MIELRGTPSTTGFNMGVGAVPKLPIGRTSAAKKAKNYTKRLAQEQLQKKQFDEHKLALKATEMPSSLAANPGGEIPKATVIQKGVRGAKANPAYLSYKTQGRKWNSLLAEQQFVQVAPEKYGDPVPVTGKVSVPGKPELLPGYALPAAPEPITPPKGKGPKGGLTREQSAAHRKAVAQQAKDHEANTAAVVDKAHDEANNLLRMRATNATNNLRRVAVAEVQSPPKPTFN